jgi:hypothetical protein
MLGGLVDCVEDSNQGTGSRRSTDAVVSNCGTVRLLGLPGCPFRVRKSDQLQELGSDGGGGTR